MSQTNSILIGKKPTMNYVLAALTLLQGGENEICIKARGRAIPRAVDVAEIIRQRYMQNLKIKDIKIGTQQLTSESSTPSNVSTIEISVIK